MKTDAQVQQDVVAELEWELSVNAAQIGVPKDHVIRYETALKAEKCVLIVHGSAEEVAKARSVLAGSRELETA